MIISNDTKGYLERAAQRVARLVGPGQAEKFTAEFRREYIFVGLNIEFPYPVIVATWNMVRQSYDLSVTLDLKSEPVRLNTNEVNYA